jgi:hypothetical protein
MGQPTVTRATVGIALLAVVACTTGSIARRDSAGPLAAVEPSIVVQNQSIHSIVDVRVTHCDSDAVDANRLMTGPIRPGQRRRFLLAATGCHTLLTRLDGGEERRWQALTVSGEAVVDVTTR